MRRVALRRMDRGARRAATGGPRSRGPPLGTLLDPRARRGPPRGHRTRPAPARRDSSARPRLGGVAIPLPESSPSTHTARPNSPLDAAFTGRRRRSCSATLLPGVVDEATARSSSRGPRGTRSTSRSCCGRSSRRRPRTTPSDLDHHAPALARCSRPRSRTCSSPDRPAADGPRRLAQVAAVLGREFPVSVLERVAGDGAEDDLAGLLRAEIVRELRRYPELVCAFSHGLLQEAALSSLTPARRRELPPRVAAAFEELHEDSLDDHLERLAHYHAQSGNVAGAPDYLERAAAGPTSLAQDPGRTTSGRAPPDCRTADQALLLAGCGDVDAVERVVEEAAEALGDERPGVALKSGAQAGCCASARRRGLPRPPTPHRP